MEIIEKTISKVASQYEINTGAIFIQLTGWDKKWKKYDRQFLIKTFQDAINSALWQKDIITVQYNEGNGSSLKNYETIRYPGAVKDSEDSRIFPPLGVSLWKITLFYTSTNLPIDKFGFLRQITYL